MKVNCKALGDMLALLRAYSPKEVKITPGESGWAICALDDTHCAMMSATLFASAFPDGYTAEDEFVTDYEFLADAIAKKADADIKVGDGQIVITSGKSKYKHRLLDVDVHGVNMPALQMNGSVVVISDDLLTLAGLKQFKTSSSDMGIAVDITEEGITFHYDGPSEGYSETYDLVMSDLPDGPQYSHYGPNLLIPALKTLPKGVPIVVAMSTDYPVKFSARTENYEFTMMIAPMISND